MNQVNPADKPIRVNKDAGKEKRSPRRVSKRAGAESPASGPGDEAAETPKPRKRAGKNARKQRAGAASGAENPKA